MNPDNNCILENRMDRFLKLSGRFETAVIITYQCNRNVAFAVNQKSNKRILQKYTVTGSFCSEIHLRFYARLAGGLYSTEIVL